jgi:hypothetical protein
MPHLLDVFKTAALTGRHLTSCCCSHSGHVASMQGSHVHICGELVASAC